MSAVFWRQPACLRKDKTVLVGLSVVSCLSTMQGMNKIKKSSWTLKR
jgi:hypothetical protein